MYYEGQLIEILCDEPNDADLRKGDVVKIQFVDTEYGALAEVETTCGWYLSGENFRAYVKSVRLPEDLFHV